MKALLYSLLFCCFIVLPAYSQDYFYVPDMVYVKMKDDAGYNVKERQLVNSNKEQAGVLSALQPLGYWARVHETADAKLEQWRRNAAKNLDKPMPDLRMEFHFVLTDKENREKALALLRQLKDAEKVLRVPRPVASPLPADFVPNQLYDKSIATGIGADSVRIVYQNKGAGIKFCDVEYAFNQTHADYATVTVIGGTPVDPFGTNGDHGTAVLGEVISKDNSWGTTGLAPDCKPYFSSAYVSQFYNLGGAMTRTLDTLKAGDVLLLEQQIGGPNMDTITPETQKGLVPVEWFQPYYNVIQLAVGNGIIVVEAAGNGDEDLDDAIYNTGNAGHYPFQAGNNSGAIIVGAGGVGGSADVRSRLYFSNYGTRVDVQGNGEGVTTTGYGDLYDAEGADYHYTSQFGGTSSASPIVAGAAILLQSVYKQQHNGSVLSPAQVRSLLITTGKPQLSGGFPLSYKIGPLPNVYAAIKKALDNATALPELFENTGVAIYPNPGQGKYNLVYAGGVPASSVVQVYTVAGNMIRSYSPAKGKTTAVEIDLSGQPDGIYFVRLVSPGSSQVRRIVLQH